MINRRNFIRGSAALSGLAITIRYLPSTLLAENKSEPLSQLLQKKSSWMKEPGIARYRYEGLAKITGEKIFARDFKVQDMDGWPKEEYKVVLLKTSQVHRPIENLDFSSLPQGLKPSLVIMGDQLDRDSIRCHPFFHSKILLKKGEYATYFGQPVALIFFKSREFSLVKSAFQNPDIFFQYGAEIKVADKPAYLDEKFLKYKHDGQILFSSLKNGGSLNLLSKVDEKFLSRKAQFDLFSQKIQDDATQKKWRIFEHTYKTQSIDPCFMEAECGLSWHNKVENTLHFLTGSQSPFADAEHISFLFSEQTCPIKIKNIDVNACYPGGGFGGKDRSSFALYLALAAIYADGVPISMANTRFDQFQFGLKRHAAKMQKSIAIDADGHFQALRASYIFDGGGYDNFSWAVPTVGADNAGSSSYFPNVDLHFKAHPSQAVPAGSVRGFGAFQVQFALESLIDEIAEHMNIDAVELRIRNAWKEAHENVRGRKPNNTFQVTAILEKVKQHELWKKRDETQKQSNKKTMHGVGFAMAMKSYGTTRDSALAEVKISPEGLISIGTNYLDMGNGTATTLALACAHKLGQNASEMKMGMIKDFNILELFSEFCTKQERLDELAKNPRFTPEIMMSTAASAGAYQHRHVVLQASEILFEQGVWPAALLLWNKEPVRHQLDAKKAFWKQAELHYEGLAALPLSELAACMHRNQLMVAVMVHGYYQAAWSKAEFQIGARKEFRPIDALAWKRATKEYELQTRSQAVFPAVHDSWGAEDIFTPCAALCRVSIERSSGDVHVDEMHMFLDCGPVIQEQIVEGQVEGAIAMGIGQTLYEEFPQTDGGPGAGLWNLHRYHLPLAREVAVRHQTLTLIPPISAHEDPKGMAEVVLHPVPPAIANAIAHATGKRFRELPISAKKIKEALS